MVHLTVDEQQGMAYLWGHTHPFPPAFSHPGLVMLRICILVVLLLCLGACARSQDEASPPASSQTAEPVADAPAEKSTADRVKADPNDTEAWLAYGQEKLGDISELIDNDPPTAIARLKEVQEFIKNHPATEPEAQDRLARFNDNIEQLLLTAEIMPRSLAELATEFEAKQSDPQALLRYRTKLEMELMPLTFSEPEKAAQITKTAKEQFSKAVAHTTDKATEQNLYKALLFIRSQEAQIEMGRQIQAMNGKDAAPLVVDAWINSKPLTDEDLKGKVVLLDFWAIWCGACISSFPDLKQWQQEYADKGLVIIGVTRYFGFKYDEERGGIVQTDDEASPAEERIALEKFAEYYQLTHALAVDKGEDLFEYYHAQALPHLVLIGRDGKIAKTFVGGGKAISQQVEAELKRLLEVAPPNGK
jgi:thiol-disulfide isomerase/thioredoxin